MWEPLPPPPPPPRFTMAGLLMLRTLAAGLPVSYGGTKEEEREEWGKEGKKDEGRREGWDGGEEEGRKDEEGLLDGRNGGRKEEGNRDVRVRWTKKGGKGSRKEGGMAWVERWEKGER